MSDSASSEIAVAYFVTSERRVWHTLTAPWNTQLIWCLNSKLLSPELTHIMENTICSSRPGHINFGSTDSLVAAAYKQINSQERTCSSLHPIRSFFNSATCLWRSQLLHIPHCPCLQVIQTAWATLSSLSGVSALTRSSCGAKTMGRLCKVLALKTTQRLYGLKSTFGIKQIALQLRQLDTEGAGGDPTVWALQTLAMWHKMPPPWSRSDPNPLALHKVWPSDESDLHSDAHKPSSAHEHFEC